MFIFPKKVTLLIIAKQNVQYDLLHRCVTPQLSFLLFRFVAFHYDMTKWNLLGCSFSLKGLVQAAKKAKEKGNHYSVIEQNALSESYMENIIKCSHPKITGQNDRQDESLTGQVHDQAGLSPLTGCNLKPCHPQSQVWHFRRYGTSQENCSVNTRVGAICGFSTCKLLATNMLVKFYMNGHRQHTIQLKNKQPTRVNHTGVFAFTQIC